MTTWSRSDFNMYILHVINNLMDLFIHKWTKWICVGQNCCWFLPCLEVEILATQIRILNAFWTESILSWFYVGGCVCSCLSRQWPTFHMINHMFLWNVTSIHCLLRRHGWLNAIQMKHTEIHWQKLMCHIS